MRSGTFSLPRLGIMMIFKVFLMLAPLAWASDDSRIWFEGQYQKRQPAVELSEVPALTTGLVPSVWTTHAPGLLIPMMDMVPPVTNATKVLERGLVKIAVHTNVFFNGGNTNFVMSPLSVAVILSVLLLATSGQTSDEIVAVLGGLSQVNFTNRADMIHEHMGRFLAHLHQSPGTTVGQELSLAVGGFFQTGIILPQSFRESALRIYKCEVNDVDFARDPMAKQKINKWVMERTNGRIKDMMESLDPKTVAVIANALYFNGAWEIPFPLQLTKYQSFYVTPEQRISVQMMVNGAEVPYLDRPDFTALALPYKGNQLSMYFVLPKSTLDTFVDKVNDEMISDIVEASVNQTVIYTIPRLKLDSQIDLIKPLQKLGIKRMFTPGIDESGGVRHSILVDQIVHKVGIELTETGTVAFAATIASTSRASTPTFRLNRPFLFFIHHRDLNVIVFYGTVVNPLT